MMKRIVLIHVAVCYLFSFAYTQPGKNGPADPIQLVISKPGQPAGEAANKKIGKNGGTIISADGRVELIFPEGALTKKSEITIQPVGNTMPGGYGKAYHLLPSGITFQQPAEIIFHYKNHELNGNDPGLLGIAMQDDKGQWHGLRNFTLDTINGTLKAQVRHFSYWVNYFTASIQPATARVKVNKELLLQIYSFQTNNDEELAPLSLVRASIPPMWTVNGVTNGNTGVGTVRTNGEVLWASLYKAPATVPDHNPVAVTAEIKGLNFKIGNQSYNNLKLTSNILVYDNAYEVRIEGWNDNTAHGMCTRRMIDSASFVVQLAGNKSRVIDVRNTLHLQPVKTNCPCSYEWLNEALCLGPIHIGAIKSINVQPVPGKPYSHVRIDFITTTAPIPVFRISCPNQVFTAPPMPFRMPTLPGMLEFDTKDESQVISEIGNESNGGRITVRRIGEN